MATTRYKIAEQVLRIVNGGDPTEDSSIDIREVMLLVDQERDALIKSEIMDWYYTKSTATAKGELEINGGWISQATIPLQLDESRNGALYAALDFSYISLPNDMGIQKVETVDVRYQEQSVDYKVTGSVKETEYKRDSTDIVFSSGPKVLDKKYHVSFDYILETTTMSDGATTQHQYGGVRTKNISFNVDTTGYNSFENQHYNFLFALVNSPGFKKFVKDYDIKYGVTENDPNDNTIIDGLYNISQQIQVRLSTNYGSKISNLKINGIGTYDEDPATEYGGIVLSGVNATNDDLGFAWTLSYENQSINSNEETITAHENSHGIGFVINGTVYTSEFVSPKKAIAPIDIIEKFVQENSQKIAKEQNIICRKGYLGLGFAVPIIQFVEVYPQGGFDIDPITPGTGFNIVFNSDTSSDPSPAAEGYSPTTFYRMPSGGDHNSLYNKTVEKTGRQYYYVENLVNHGEDTGELGGAAIYLYKKHDYDFFNHRYGNRVRITYIGSSSKIEDHVPYPVPADYEKIIIKNLVELLTVMKNASDDMVNDNID